MRIVSLIGRIIFGVFWVFNGINLLMTSGASAGYAAAKGVPAAQAAVLVAGLLILIGGAMILTGFRVDIGAWMIVVFLIPVTFMMHRFWEADAASQMNEIINFTKNIALLGAALMIASIRYWPIALDRPSQSTGG